MGADLILNALAHRKDVELDYEAGREAIRTMELDRDKLEFLCDEWLFEHYEPDTVYDEDGGATYEEAIQAHALGALNDLEKALGNYRDATYFLFGDWVIHVAGGMSWGDSPGETFDSMTTLSELPEVLKAIGFEWPTSEQVDT